MSTVSTKQEAAASSGLASSGSSDRFRALCELGRGGKGLVMLVQDRLRAEALALKRLRHGSAVDVRQLKREYRAIERIVHANIVTVYELGFDAEGPYLLMEAVDGVNLFGYCRPGEGVRIFPSSSIAPLQPELTPSHVERTQRARLGGETEGSGSTTRNLTATSADDVRAGRLSARASTPIGDLGYARLYCALPQLLSALECLHRHGLVHRDLKPANVLVRRDDVLKLLDFGILGETGDVPAAAMQGTAAYIAPEQIRGEAPAPSNDLYALAFILFEIVTGHLPFVGPTRHELLLQHVHAPAIDVRELSPECPAWLAELIAGLLHKDPAARMDLAYTRSLCARMLGSYVEPAPTVATLELLERKQEQGVLLDLLDSDDASFRFVTISGASGIGKSALLAWTRAAIRRRQLTAFESRARFSELVPFNSLDGLVDDLAVTLERFPELTDDDEGKLLRDVSSAAFSVLARSQTPATRPRAFERKAVFDALIALLERCTRITGRLLLLCDDLQWSDADSISLLDRLITAAPRGVTILATVRDDTQSEPFAHWSKRVVPDVTLRLRPLSERALATIIHDVARDAGQPIDVAIAERAAKGCDGRPLLAVVSGRVVGAPESDAALQPIAWLLGAYARRGESERLLLSLLAAIDNEASLPRLARISELGSGAVEHALAPLLREGLISAAGSFGERRRYDFSHDLIRTHTGAVLDVKEIRRAHALLADDAERTGDVPAALRVRHLLGAERFAKAAEVALLGARDAESANAFGLAVDLYGIAIDHGHDTEPLQEARAVALERSGRYLEAAEQWGKLADRRAGEVRMDASLQQAKALLAAGEIGLGRTIIRRVRSERRERDTLPGPLGDALAIARFLLGPEALPGGVRLEERGISTAIDERDVFLGTMIGYFDPIAGIRHILRARGNYRRLGNRTQAAEVEYVLAYLALWTSPLQAKTELGERYLRSARGVLGGCTLPSHGRPYALDLMVRGVRSLHEGRYAEASELLEAAIAFYRETGRRGSFEYLFCWLNRLYAAQFSQDLAGFRRALETTRKAMRDGHDSALHCHVGFAEVRLLLLSGEIEAARRVGRETLSTWPQDEPSYQRFLSRLALLTPELYSSDGARSWVELKSLMREHARFIPTRNMLGSDVLSHAAMFELIALRSGAPDASLASIERLATRAARTCPTNRHLAMRAAGYAADHVGRPERALRWLERAEFSAIAVEQPIDVAVARYQRGIRLGGDQGAELVTSAERLIARASAHPQVLREDPGRR